VCGPQRSSSSHKLRSPRKLKLGSRVERQSPVPAYGGHHPQQATAEASAAANSRRILTEGKQRVAKHARCGQRLQGARAGGALPQCLELLGVGAHGDELAAGSITTGGVLSLAPLEGFGLLPPGHRRPAGVLGPLLALSVAVGSSGGRLLLGGRGAVGTGLSVVAPQLVDAGQERVGLWPQLVQALLGARG